jgi:hypothetical protein
MKIKQQKKDSYWSAFNKFIPSDAEHQDRLTLQMTTLLPHSFRLTT